MAEGFLWLWFEGGLAALKPLELPMLWLKNIFSWLLICDLRMSSRDSLRFRGFCMAWLDEEGGLLTLGKF